MTATPLLKSPTTIAIVGDLHYEPASDAEYRRAREQLLSLAPHAVFQLGDQGGYSHAGSWRSFMEGLDFLKGFDRPYHALIGNHDLEGAEFGSDAQAVAAWCKAFGRTAPYAAFDLGGTLAVCLSSARFRGNRACQHEVYLDDEQVDWLDVVLGENRDRPTFIFSHAPILGSGLRVLQSLHLKCPNAWLNHTDRPERFIERVGRNPQIKLWFSAHNHLGQMYRDSASRVGGCTFVHTGVIGPVSRDGRRHSRLVDFDPSGFLLSTLDHTSGLLTANVRHDYATGAWSSLSGEEPTEESVHFAPPACPSGEDRLCAGRSVFALHRGMLVEYDQELAAPVGVVLEGLTTESLRIRGDVIEVAEAGGRVRIFRPNGEGRYLQVFEPNPYRDQRWSA